jgi:hypothetical protein
MNLPAPTPGYSVANEAAVRRALEQEDRRNRKIGANVELGREQLVLKSPNGNRWAITVSNAGVVGAAAL